MAKEKLTPLIKAFLKYELFDNIQYVHNLNLGEGCQNSFSEFAKMISNKEKSKWDIRQIRYGEGVYATFSTTDKTVLERLEQIAESRFPIGETYILWKDGDRLEVDTISEEDFQDFIRDFSPSLPDHRKWNLPMKN